MRQGGNRLVNALFEATLTDKQRRVVRPDNHTDLATRTDYIFDKYQHRTWFSKESYDTFRPTDRIDAALSSLRSHKENTKLEEDFFSQRAKSAAPNNNTNSSSGQHFAANDKPSNDSEWWKVASTSTSNGSSISNSTPVNNRRGLLTKMQAESQRKLMDEFHHLESKNGSVKPSELKLKSKVSSPKNGSRMGVGGMITQPIKQSPSKPRSTLQRQRGVPRTYSNSSTRSSDSIRSKDRGVGRTYSSSSHSSGDSSTARRVPKTKDRVSRAKSFDEGLVLDSTQSPDSIVKRNRVRKTNSDRLPPTSSRSLKGNESFIQDIHTSLAQITKNTAGVDDMLSPRRPQRRRPEQTGSGFEDQSQGSSRRIVRDDKSQASRRSTRSSSKHDDQSQLSSSRRHRTGSRARSPEREDPDYRSSPRRREGSRSRQLPPSRTPSPDLMRGMMSPKTPGGPNPIAVTRVTKDRRPRVPSRPVSSNSPVAVGGSSTRQIDAKFSSEIIDVKW
jgi:hypothetical protein